MKSNLKYILLLLIPIMMGGVFQSCSDDEAAEGGDPVIHYIRVTEPAQSDSLLESAYMGNLVAIIGENLGGARELWFNDQKAELSPTYVSNQSILVNVPNNVPIEITNELKLVMQNGKEYVHPFTVNVPAPVISALKSEYVMDGNEAVIQGDYFYEPISVIFPGDVEAEVVSVEKNAVRVIVPEGTPKGQVTVKTNFGKATSKQVFRDDRGIFADMNGTTVGFWHGPQFLVESDPVIPNIDGKFIRLNQDLAEGQWLEFLVAPTDSDINTENVPADAIKNPANYSLKFEINTLKPFVEGTNIYIYFGNDMAGERGDKNISYLWEATIDTKGEWQTVIIPFNEVIKNVPISVDPNGYGVSFWFWDGVAMPLDFAVDNFRIVPKD